MTISTIRDTRISGFVRHILFAAVVACAALAAGAAHAQSDVAQRIAEHFSSMRTMTGEFVQFGPRGEQTGGKFYLERPGKIRFDYQGDARFRVVSDGTSVILENRKMNTVDIYSLGQTPLKVLLADRIDLSGSKVQSVDVQEDVTTIRFVDKKLFGDTTITMMFDSDSYELRQWTVTDAQGRDTTVMLFNVQRGVTFDPSVFHIDYRRVNEINRANSNRN
ncbi:outer-membrane lipoprotein carrier protein LolA [Chelativorans sp. M5D2P16]|uniref:outer-membrane lipoprotein carrier protein LolA n=1 Tax=Chelativorans sp. M5D2P16 TaxID=3095678 RepID=UPI002ACACFE5|nr:outer-membrane lipoprotein carrier protein LolA [Chelativorans sp. M5D2P16]MDZ5699327.1 outer-membrane lipoprotein carrier protein LolA [Chelativorans sp. M5D2P16]